MRIKVTMVVETEDYGGREFKNEIETLIANIDQGARLVQFTMQQADGATDAWRDFSWKAVATDPDDEAFEHWLRRVDAFVWSGKGCSIHDLLYRPLRDWFIEGLSPVAAAQRAVAELEEELGNSIE